MNLILNGPGRSGTTLLSKMMCYHKDFAWISGWVNRYPSMIYLSYFNNLYKMNIANIDLASLKKNTQAN